MQAHLNGKAPHPQDASVHQAQEHGDAPVAIEVFSIKDGTSSFLRMLSPRYGGIMTHYLKSKGSKYCAGPECMYLCSKLEKTWKGYCAAELWLRSVKKWRPVVLELTERLEQDMRGIYERGQMWECWKHSPVDGKRQPVEGKLQPPQVFKNLRPEFDWQAVVRNMYHMPSMDFSVKNSLAPRVILADVEGDEPIGLAAQIENEATEEEWNAFRERMKQFNKTKKTPTEKKQGK